MGIAALITWVVAAVLGFTMLTIWITRNRSPQSERSRFSASRPYIHFLLAATGLVVWIIYLLADVEWLAWVAAADLAVVALIGLSMFLIWLPQARSTERRTPEQHFPAWVVGLHGLFAVTTFVLVILAALEIGS